MRPMGGYLCKVYIRQTPSILKALASHLTWNGPAVVNGKAAVYLTFDDGPHPEITVEVMRLLGEHGAKGVFFCVGENVQRHPEVVIQLRDEGHGIGNHTQRHESGWDASQFSYLKSYAQCQALLNAPWFRPPYGRITKGQAEALRAHTEIVMWDVLSADFDERNSPESCLEHLMLDTRPGAIVVFHDSEKAAPRMLPVLETYLRWLNEEGYECHILPRQSS